MKIEGYQLKNPFGEVCFEDEHKLLKEHYKDYFFDHVPFNANALDPDVYLIIGRKGAGKSSLAFFFTFQNYIKNARCIDVDEPQAYQHVLPDVAKIAADTNAIAIPQIVTMWEAVIWLLIFDAYKSVNPLIAKACFFRREQATVSQFVRNVMKHFLSLISKSKDGKLADEAENLLSSELVQQAKEVILPHLKKIPVIIAIDTLEHYDVNNEPMMRATAALIECASNFNTKYASRGIHVKLFVTAEVFSRLRGQYVSNPLKYVRDEIYMHWRPRDIIRLLCWRFHKYLSVRGRFSDLNPQAISWDDFSAVYERVWKPYFGGKLINRRGIEEPTFPYMLRHTQNRPRQMIVLCNAIAKACDIESKNGPFDPNVVVNTVWEVERVLATEVINSYREVYHNCGQIVDALMNFPLVFNGKLLDKFAPSTSSNWASGQYSPYNFRQLVAELGIVGRVRERDEQSHVIAADFEYFLKGRLSLMTSDACVIHPMFCGRLNVSKKEPYYRIYPFPDHPDFNDVFRSGMDQ